MAKVKQENTHQHEICAAESPPALSVHFENGEFRDIDRLVLILLFLCKKRANKKDRKKH